MKITQATVRQTAEATEVKETAPAAAKQKPAELVPAEDNALAQSLRNAAAQAKPGAGGKQLAVTAAYDQWLKEENKAEMKAFKQSGYSVDDAKQAMKVFDFLPTLTEAKRYIGLKILNGAEDMLSEKGITPNDFDDHECFAAFQRSGYSDADVAQAKKSFDFLKGKSDRYVQEYIGLKIVNGYEEMLKEVGITQLRFDSHELMAAFKQGGYTTADAKKALDSFDFLKGSSLKDAKEYIGLKVVNNWESILTDVGITPSGKK